MWNSAIRARAAFAVPALLLAAALPAATAHAADTPHPPDPDIEALREQVRQLDQQIRVLQRKQELKDEAAATAVQSAPKLTVSDGRIEIASADGGTSLRLRGLVQADYRWFDSANDPADTFLLRRARLIFEGRFGGLVDYVVQPEFAGTIQILDAYLNVHAAPWLQVQAGKFKVPIGLEWLQSDAVALFNERSVATNLVPGRDVGVQLHGDLLDSRLTYSLALLDGVPDGGNNTTGAADSDHHKTLAARLFATPFAGDADSPLSGLGFGVAASVGDYSGASGRTSGYRTDGQQAFFSYASDVVAAGRGRVWSPQAYYCRGPLGLVAEYVDSSVELRRGDAGAVHDVSNRAAQLSIGYVLTGENAGYRGVTPRKPFNPGAGTWGAVEVVARVATLAIDDAVFDGPASTRLASPSTSASGVTTYGLGLNWYLSRSARAGLDVFRDTFDLAPGSSPASTALVSGDETSISTRLQLSF